MLDFQFTDAPDWLTSLQKACKTFKQRNDKPAFCLLVGEQTLNSLSEQPEPTSYYITRDLLGRINFIIHYHFVLDVLITDIPYKHFKLTDDPKPKNADNYNRILTEALKQLNQTRNNTLSYITVLSLNGEMEEVTEMLSAEDIQLKDYSLDDFKRVEDSNVRNLTEVWHFLNEKISILESDNI